MKEKLTISKIFDRQTATEIRNSIESLEPARWVNRSYLQYGRSVEGSGCCYDFCGHKQMPEKMRTDLKNIAPQYDGFPLAEIAVNRYKVGDFIGKHRDRDLYRLNLVIALQESGDGLLIDDENVFVEDVIGQGVLFKGVGPVHSVPPVKNQRYSLIYLYE